MKDEAWLETYEVFTGSFVWKTSNKRCADPSLHEYSEFFLGGGGWTFYISNENTVAKQQENMSAGQKLANGCG